MADPELVSHVVHFGAFEVDLRSGELRKHGLKIKIQEQPLQVLAMLLEHPGQTVTREELRKKLWPADTFVDFEHGLNAAINKLRETLGDSAENPRFVETLHRRGYRFIAPVVGTDGGAPVVPPASPPAADVGAGLVPAQGRPQGAPLRKWRVAALAAGVVLLIGGAIGYRHFRKPPSPPMRAVPFTTFPGSATVPSFSPDGNQIAFAWNGEKEDNWDIYVKVIGTESVLRLTTNPASDHAPAWSPDGRYIAFYRHTEGEDGIYLVPALGGPERKLYSTLLSVWYSGPPSWSPDGKYLAFTENLPGEGPSRVSVLSVETLNKRVVTSPAPPDFQGDLEPRFSPDGKTLGFVRGLTAPGAFVLCLVPAAGGEPQRITYENDYVGEFAWAPDSAHLIYAGSRGGTLGLWKISVAGGEPERLPVGGEDASQPALSRDGRRLAYVKGSGQANIWRYEVPRGSGRPKPPTRLIAAIGGQLSQQFSPDGKRIVFASGRSGNWCEIWESDSDGSNPVQLTNFGGPVAGTPRWSPDGRHVVFDCNAGDNEDIYAVSVDGGPPRRLTSEKSQEVTASWSRDGKWIYFASDRTGAWQTWKMPAEGGKAVQVTRGGGFAAFESYDGKTLYYAKGLTVPGLWKVPVEGGEETLVLEQLAATLWGYWGLTQEGIYFYDAATHAIEFFSFATRKVTKVVTPERDPLFFNPGFSVSPDGRWILYAQNDISASHIMLVDNFHW
jgi:Tol biopolymer transport system component/DNA-binding winged helix-turn-helix (wHTH) protein